MNAVTVSQSFEERLFEKIKADIGQLMTDDELKKLVDKSMDRIFFSPVIERDNYGQARNSKPPEIERLLAALMAPRLDAVLKEWLAAHPDEVKAALDLALRDGLASAIVRAFNSMMQSAMFTLQNNLQTAFQQAMQSR